MASQHIAAFARLRPFSKQEVDCNARKCLDITEQDVTVHFHQNTRKYNFDRVFGPDSKQKDMYNTIVEPIIEEVMQGFNCTVFAYGQTGTGKTYTMVGSPSNVDKSYTQDSEAGIIPRTVGHIFEKYKTNPEIELTVRVSYLELYNEQLIDLLSNEDKVLKIYEDQRHKGSVQIHGLEEITVHDKNQVYEILERGAEKRMTACTLMNVRSSRSHTVFTITLHCRESTPDCEEVVKTGKLNLVDLAGSEDISKSGAKDKRAREAGNINQSLLTLGRVIKALVEKSAHIPYRESKLTRILQDSLGGKTKTTIIATVSPASSNLEETMSTLDYAHRAKDITTRPEVNLKTTRSGVIQRYLQEISKLKRDIEAARTQEGVYLQPDNYDSLIMDYEESKVNLLRYIGECSELNGRVKELERVRDELEAVFSITKRDLEEATDSLEKSKVDLQKLYKERELHQELIDKYDEAQTSFEQYARALSKALDTHICEHRTLRTKVHNLYEINTKNETSTNSLLDSEVTVYNAIASNINSVCKNVQSKRNDLQTVTSDLTNLSTSDFKNLELKVKNFENATRDILVCFKSSVQHIRSTTNSESSENHCNVEEEKYKTLKELFNNDFNKLVREMKNLKEHCAEIHHKNGKHVNDFITQMFEHFENVAESLKQVQAVKEENFKESNVLCDNCIEKTKTKQIDLNNLLKASNQELDEIEKSVIEMIKQAKRRVSLDVASNIAKCDALIEKVESTKETNEKSHSAYMREVGALRSSCEQAKCILTECCSNLESTTKESQDSFKDNTERIHSLFNSIKMDSEEYQYILKDLLRNRNPPSFKVDYLNNLQLLLIKHLRELSNQKTLFVSNSLQEIDACILFIANNAKDFANTLEKMEKGVITGEGLNKVALSRSQKIIEEFVRSFEVGVPNGDTPHKDLGFGPFKTPKKINKSVLKFADESDNN